MARHLPRSACRDVGEGITGRKVMIYLKFSYVLSYSRCGNANAVTSFLPLPSVLEVVRFKWHKSVTITNAGLRRIGEDLQIVLISRFCNFQKAKPWITICKCGLGQTDKRAPFF